jgi:hypothetical protein
MLKKTPGPAISIPPRTTALTTQEKIASIVAAAKRGDKTARSDEVVHYDREWLKEENERRNAQGRPVASENLRFVRIDGVTRQGSAAR